MGSVQNNGQPESAAGETGSGPGNREAEEQSPATQTPVDPVRETPDAAGTDASAGTSSAPGPAPASSSGPAPSYAAPPQDPAAQDPATVTPAGVAATPGQHAAGPAAPFPAAPAAVPPPPGWAPPPPGWAQPPPGWPQPPPGAPPYATGSPSYPPGPYPPPAPYPAPSISRQPRRRASWAAPSPTRTHRWGLGGYLLAEAVFLLVGGLISGYVIVTGAQPTVGLLILGLAAPTVLAATVALLITRVRGNGPRADLGLVFSWRDVRVGLAFGFGGLALTIPASIVYVAIVGDDATSAVGDVFGGIRAGPALAALVLVIVVFVAPMCEEILYRGLLWGGIEKIAGRWVAFAVSTLLFAIAHFEFTRTPLLLVVAIPIAIARLYTGRLLASIVAHQINNLLPGIALVLGLLGVVPMA